MEEGLVIIGPEYIHRSGVDGNAANIDTVIFDLDGTLVMPLAPEFKHSTDITRFKLRDNIRTKLPPHVVIFTNQLRTDIEFVRKKIALVEAVAVVTAYIMTRDDRWRKPSPDALLMFMESSKLTPGGVVYIGDAAGRRSDFSDSDRKFAMNAGVSFMTPEVYFDGVDILSDNEQYYLRGFDPSAVSTDTVPIIPVYVSYAKELIILVGPPSCGKTTFAQRAYPCHKRVNQDTINCSGVKKGTYSQCLRFTKMLMEGGYAIVVDNTNPTADVRKGYIELARRYGYTVKCILLNISKDLAIHLGRCRKVLGGASIPAVAYGKYFSIFEYPNTDEGFTLEVRGFMPNFDKKGLKVFNYRF